MTTSGTPARQTNWVRVGPLAAGVAAFVVLVIVAFTWPSVTSRSHHLPLDIAGGSSEVGQTASALNAGGHTFDVRAVTSRRAAVQDIRSRRVYGAVVLRSSQTPEVLESSAASPAAAQLVGAISTQLQQQLQDTADKAARGKNTSAPHVTVPVKDIVPLAPNDQAGTKIAAAAFPITLGGMLGGIFLSYLVFGIARRLLGLIAYAAVVGFGAAGVLQGWFGILHHSYWLNASVLALALGSIAGTVLGAMTLFKRVGLAVGPLLFVLFANPLSSAATPVEFLPRPWGDIGQYLPPGAAARLVRDLSYFPDAGSAKQWLVLAVWALFGVSLIGFPAIQRQGSIRSLRRHSAHPPARLPALSGHSTS